MKLINDNIDKRLKQKFDEKINFLMQMLVQLNVKSRSFVKNSSASDLFSAFDSSFAVEAVSNFSQLCFEEVDYFDSEYEKEKNKHSTIINADKYVYYKDVYIFVNCLKNLIIQYNEITVKKVIVSILRDFALM